MTSATTHRRLRAAGTVLVVEDDPVMKTAVRGALEEEGYVAWAASTLEEARDAIARGGMPDVVVLDLLFDREFGAHLLEELAVAPEPPVVVIVSGFGLAPLVAARFDVEALQKPFELPMLVERVERAVRERRVPKPAATA